MVRHHHIRERTLRALKISTPIAILAVLAIRAAPMLASAGECDGKWEYNETVGWYCAYETCHRFTQSCCGSEIGTGGNCYE